MVDRRCVFLIDPCPNPPALNASVDRFGRLDHTIPGYSLVGDEAVVDPTDLDFGRPIAPRASGRCVLHSERIHGSPLKSSAQLRQGVGRAVLGGLDSLVRFALMMVVWPNPLAINSTTAVTRFGRPG